MAVDTPPLASLQIKALAGSRDRAWREVVVDLAISRLKGTLVAPQVNVRFEIYLIEKQINISWRGIQMMTYLR